MPPHQPTGLAVEHHHLRVVGVLVDDAHHHHAVGHRGAGRVAHREDPGLGLGGDRHRSGAHVLAVDDEIEVDGAALAVAHHGGATVGLGLDALAVGLQVPLALARPADQQDTGCLLAHLHLEAGQIHGTGAGVCASIGPRGFRDWLGGTIILGVTITGQEQK